MDETTLRDLGLLLATLGGAAVGVERERSGRIKGQENHFAGVRTFTLLGGLGGGAGWLYAAGLPWVGIVLLASGAMVALLAYAAGSREHDIDGTTEVAALVTLMAGVFAGAGHARLAGAIIAVTVLILAEKSRVHDFVDRMDEMAMRAAIRFTVMAVVILPMLPQGPYGPLGGFRPRELWLLVLFFSGLSFIGYMARMFVGARQGYLIAGLLGGIVSSTSVTLTFSRASRTEDRKVGAPLGYGAIGACTVMFVKIVAVTAVLSSTLMFTLLPYIAAPFLVGVAGVAIGWRRPQEERREIQTQQNPLQFSSALQMAVLFQVVMFVVHAVRAAWGDLGVIVSGATLGLVDVDALLLSMARTASTSGVASTSALAVAVGALSNTLLKLGFALTIARPPFRRVVGIGLGAMALAALGSILLIR
ncbi:MAG: MgtC/SapB family protein [Acidobacteria bacterium]|nr:MgtC/SapB family protein [Acidobacteriota bacterium]